MIAKLEGVAHVEPTIFERVNHSHILVQLEPHEDRHGHARTRSCSSVRDDDEGLPAVPSERHRPRRARRRRECRPCPSRAVCSGPTCAWRRTTRCGCSPIVQKSPLFTDPKVTVNLAFPGDSGGRRSPSRRRSRRADLDGGAGAAADGQRPGRDLDLSRRTGAVSGEDSRAGGSAARHRVDREAHRALGEGRPGAHRQHRAPRARAGSDVAAAHEPAVLGRPLFGRRARRRTRRSVGRGPPPGAVARPAGRLLPSGSRARRRFSTRPPRT